MLLRNLLVLVFFTSFSQAAATAPGDRGAALYKEQCASCHGALGEGVTGKFDEPLTGERSLESLTRKIDRTMPEEDPELCAGEDARLVAAYIYDAFYSPAAQARLRPPEIDLTRLTTPQFRASVADLIGHFRPGSEKNWGAERGLRALYRSPEILTEEERVKLKSNTDPRKKTEKVERREPGVDLQFGVASPDPEKLDALEFETHIEGSVIAPETGHYEFIVRSENGFRLWINNTEKPLIYAWVSSGPEVREERASLFLVAGRAYPVVLEHFKFREKTASLQLLWKPPHGVEEIIPARQLSPERMREVMIVATNFPADDRSLGYERGTGVSPEWDQSVTQAAITVGEQVAASLNELAGTKADAPDRLEKLRRFAAEFAATAFRRPLDDATRQLIEAQFATAFRRPLDDATRQLIEAQFATAKTPELAVKRVVLYTLKSPRFLYPALADNDGAPDGHTVAARLALLLWDSLPDKKLRQEAAAGKLSKPADIQRAAQRLAADPRARAKMDGFFHHWLELDHAEATSKDPKAFPGFDQTALADLRTSLRLFLDEVVWSDTSDYRQLLQADHLHLNARLAKLYGKKVAGADFERVSFDPRQRAGVVTHPYLLSTLATARASSPIHRGVFLTRNIVGMSLKSPPVAVAFEESHFKPGLTMREKVTELTRDGACMSCHSVINPLGFSLENFDAIGRWRTKEANKPVDPISELTLEGEQTLRLTGPRDIVNHVVTNPDGHRAFIRQLFHHLVKQPAAAYGLDTLDQLQTSFVKNQFHIQKLLADIATRAALQP